LLVAALAVAQQALTAVAALVAALVGIEHRY
jgi:hypothetical protein